MATRTVNRRALRDQNDAAEEVAEDEERDEDSEDGAETPAPKAKKARARKAPATTDKKPAKPRVRKKAAKVPERMFARWAVYDNGMKRVAAFEYKDRVAADTKLAQIRESKAGTFFLLLVKDPYDPPSESVAPPTVVAG